MLVCLFVGEYHSKILLKFSSVSSSSHEFLTFLVETENDYAFKLILLDAKKIGRIHYPHMYLEAGRLTGLYSFWINLHWYIHHLFMNPGITLLLHTPVTYIISPSIKCSEMSWLLLELNLDIFSFITFAYAFCDFSFYSAACCYLKIHFNWYEYLMSSICGVCESTKTLNHSDSSVTVI